MDERMKNDSETGEKIAPTKQAVHKKTTERIGSRRQVFDIEYDTVENVDRTGNELLANWRCLVQEKGEAIQTTYNKLQNMQPSKLTENKLRQEIEKWIDFKKADRHVMKRCMHNLQISMKDRLHYLRKQKQFLLDKQQTLKNVYKSIEQSNRSRIPNPFHKFIFDIKREHYQLFNEELLISSNGSTNKYKRQMIEANTVIIGDTRLYFGKTGRTHVMTPIHENILESDKCITGECVDSCSSYRRSESELSFLNHELKIGCNMFDLSIEGKETENCSRKEKTQINELQKHAKKSKIPVPVKLPQFLANKKMKYEEKSPSSPVKLPLLLPKKKMKYVEDSYSETLKRQPLLPNKKILYSKELSDTTLKLPPVFPDTEKTCMQEHLFTNRPGTPNLLPPLQNLPQNIKKTLIVKKIWDEKKYKSTERPTESFSKPVPQRPAETTAFNEISDISTELGYKRPKWKNKYKTFRLQKRSRKIYYKHVGMQIDREKPDRYPEPDKNHTLPQNMKETSIVNKIRYGINEKSKVIPKQSTSIAAVQKTAETTANDGTLDMNSELALKRVKWENKFPTFKLQKASGKDCHISERKNRFSMLQKSSGKNCYILKSKSDKGSNIVTENYCTTRTQNRNVKNQKEIEKPDSYPAPDQIHTWPQNLKKILIVKKMRNEKRDYSEVVRSMPLSAQVQTDKTIASIEMYKSAPEEADGTTAFAKISKSTQQQADRTITSNKMSKSTQQQADETTASNKMFQPATDQTDETTASNKMYKSRQQQADDTKSSNKMSKSAPQQADKTTVSKTISKSTQQQADETTSSNKISKSTQQQADDTKSSNKMSKSALQQANKTTASNKISKSTPQQADKITNSIVIFNTPRKQNRNVGKQAKREKTESFLKPDQTHTSLDIEVDDKCPTEDIFHKLDDNELIGFYQVQEKDLFPVIENMSDSKVMELFKKLHDQHIAVIQSISNTADDTQSSNSGSTLDDFHDTEENDGTLKTSMKTFVKKLIPDCITNGDHCQPTETLSSNWQIIKIRSGTNIKTQYIPMPLTQFIPMPPNSQKPKTSNARRKQYGRKKDKNNNSSES